MGRMTEARKRARQVAAAKAPPAQPAIPALPRSGLAEDVLRETQAEPAEAKAAVPTAADAAAEAALEVARPSLLGRSSFGAPAPEQTEAVESTEDVACFFLDREEYGVDVRQVQEIRRVAEITAVPRAPASVRGVINLRGRVLPVIDLKRKLGRGEVGGGSRARIVVVRANERLVGLLVDGATRVLKVRASSIEPAPAEVADQAADYIRGVAKLDDRLVILVDIERLLAHEAAGPSTLPGSGQDGTP
jgi:purine-binding chemotaxis protein CheW